MSRRWPPLIDAGGVPTLIRVRDAAVTLVAWVFLAYFVAPMLLALVHDGLLLLGIRVAGTPSVFQVDWVQLAPSLRMVVALALWFLILVLLRRPRLLAMQARPQPPPMEPDAVFRHFGVDAAAAHKLQHDRVLHVGFDAEGRIIAVDSDSSADT